MQTTSYKIWNQVIKTISFKFNCYFTIATVCMYVCMYNKSFKD